MNEPHKYILHSNIIMIVNRSGHAKIRLCLDAGLKIAEKEHVALGEVGPTATSN